MKYLDKVAEYFGIIILINIHTFKEIYIYMWSMVIISYDKSIILCVTQLLLNVLAHNIV